MREPNLETFFRSRLRRLQENRAEVAGLRGEDIIERFAGQPVANSGDLLQALTSHEDGETVTIQFLRGNELLEVRVTLREREDCAERGMQRR